MYTVLLQDKTSIYKPDVLYPLTTNYDMKKIYLRLNEKLKTNFTNRPCKIFTL